MDTINSSFNFPYSKQRLFTLKWCSNSQSKTEKTHTGQTDLPPVIMREHVRNTANLYQV